MHFDVFQFLAVEALISCLPKCIARLSSFVIFTGLFSYYYSYTARFPFTDTILP